MVNELTDTSFARIKEVKNLRQNQASKALRYDEICQTIPDQYDTAKHFLSQVESSLSFGMKLWVGCCKMITSISHHK